VFKAVPRGGTETDWVREREGVSSAIIRREVEWNRYP